MWAEAVTAFLIIFSAPYVIEAVEGFLFPPRRRVPTIQALLKRAPVSEEFPGYETPPAVSERVWSAVGTRIGKVEHEDDDYTCRRTEQALTVRLLIHNPAATHKVRHHAEFMYQTLSYLMKFAGAQYGFTHQHEIVLMMPRSAELLYGGCFAKITTLLSSHAAGYYNRLVGMDLLEPPHPVVFSARIAGWENGIQAIRVILWRAYRAQVRGLRALAPVEMRKATPGEQLRWLHEHGKLATLDPVTAYGRVAQLVLKEREVADYKTGTPKPAMTWTVEEIPGNFLRHFEHHYPY